jgi:hypothetical protein
MKSTTITTLRSSSLPCRKLSRRQQCSSNQARIFSPFLVVTFILTVFVVACSAVNISNTPLLSNENNNNNSCYEDEECAYHRPAEELVRKSEGGDECEDEEGEDDDEEDDEEDDEDWDEEWDEDWDEDWEEEDEWEQEDDDEYNEYTSEEIKLMEELYKTYRSIISDQIGEDWDGDEEYELESMEVVYERYLEWNKPNEELEQQEEEEKQQEEAQQEEEEIDLEGREQHIHEALQRYHIEPSSTSLSSTAFNDEDHVKLTDTTSHPLSYIELPARMISVITISDATKQQQHRR